MKIKMTAATMMFLFSQTSLSQPWIASDQIYTRAAIEQLVSEGIIKRPVNSYPLMWQGIAQDIENVDESSLSQDAQFALMRLKHELRFAQKKSFSSIKVSANSEPKVDSDITPGSQSKAAIQGYSVLTGKNVSAKVSVTYRNKGENGKKTVYDGSYLAVLLGNWSLSAEQVYKWNGPSNDNALILSHNSDAMPGIRLTRLNTDYYGPSFLSFIGPWNISAFIGKNKYPKQDEYDNKYWHLRFSASPINGLELGLNQATQFDGPNEGHDFNDLMNAVVGSTKENQFGLNKYNQLSSLDIKYSTRIFNQSVAVYSELAQNARTSAAKKHTLATVGAEHFTGARDYLVKSFVEYSDNKAQCSYLGTNYHCLYQTPFYPQGYRHLGDTISSNSGDNNRSVTMGMQYQRINGYAGFIKLREKRFDQDAPYKRQMQLSVGYQQALFNGQLSVDVSAFKQVGQSGDNDYDGALSTSWEYRF